MLKIFSSFLKNKKIIVFAIFLIVGIGLIIPNITLAAWWEYAIPGWNIYAGIRDVGGKLLGDMGTSVLTALILFAALLFTITTGTISNLMGGLLLWIISFGNKVSYTGFDNEAIASGWPMIRDLANMFIVLGFVVIGIATTLRIKEYEAKKLLPKLIIVALLINFSLLICGIFIDGSNIIMTHFLKGGGYLARSVAENINAQVDEVWNSTFFTDISKLPSLLGKAISITLFNIITAIVFFIFSFTLLFRYVALWILVILSPLAFACYAFPFTKKIFDMWWRNFLNWCIIGIPLALFLFIGDKINNEMYSEPKAESIAALMVYLVPSLFLIAGFLFSLQISAMGASAAIKAGKWSGDKAIGATGGIANKLTGGRLSNARNALTSAGSRILEGVGLRAKGATATMNAGKISKQQELTKNMTNAQVLREMRNSGVRGAAAFKEATSRKILNQYAGGDIDRLAGRAQIARSWGIDTSDAEKQMPGLAGRNEGTLARIKKENPTWNADQIQREAIRAKHAGMSVGDMRSLHKSQINADFIQDSNYKTLSRAALEFTTEQKDQAQTLRPELIDRRNIALGCAGATAKERSDAYNDRFNRKTIAQSYDSMTPAQRSAVLSGLSSAEKAAVLSATSGVAPADMGKAYANALVKTRVSSLAKDAYKKVKDLENKLVVIKSL